MASNWSRHLPVVTVPAGATPKPITFVVPYYENPRFLQHQLQWWRTFPAWLREQIRAVVVDDGSPDSPAVDALKSLERPFPLRLFRIEQDIAWNWLAARNIGVRWSSGWCVLTDMDHVVPQSTAEALVYGQHDPRTIYAFSRIEHTGAHVQPHSASFFLTSDLFWRIGGYDERLSGVYGTDGLWRKRCTQAAPMKVLSDRLIRYEYVDDSSTMKYPRKTRDYLDKLKAKVASIDPDSPPLVLSFPYHEVFL